MIHPQPAHLRILRNLQIKYLTGFTTKKIEKFKSKKFGRQLKSSIYKLHLREKKKLRFFYGITENQLINYIKKASKIKGFTSITLFQLLEMRLDTIIFRFKLAPTILSARQLILHGHILVNLKKITIPSFMCNIDDEIQISNSKGYSMIQNFLYSKIIFDKTNTNFSHLKFDRDKNIGKIIDFPQKTDNFTFINYLSILNSYKIYSKTKKICYRK
jgi:small subunit ribosomal protein S4